MSKKQEKTKTKTKKAFMSQYPWLKQIHDGKPRVRERKKDMIMKWYLFKVSNQICHHPLLEHNPRHLHPRGLSHPGLGINSHPQSPHLLLKKKNKKFIEKRQTKVITKEINHRWREMKKKWYWLKQGKKG